MNPLLCSLPAATFAVIFAVQAFGFGMQLDSQEIREAYFLGRRSDQKTVLFGACSPSSLARTSLHFGYLRLSRGPRMRNPRMRSTSDQLFPVIGLTELDTEL
jgi:hypothetical protein